MVFYTISLKLTTYRNASHNISLGRTVTLTLPAPFHNCPKSQNQWYASFFFAIIPFYQKSKPHQLVTPVFDIPESNSKAIVPQSKPWISFPNYFQKTSVHLYKLHSAAKHTEKHNMGIYAPARCGIYLTTSLSIQVAQKPVKRSYLPSIKPLCPRRLVHEIKYYPTSIPIDTPFISFFSSISF